MSTHPAPTEVVRPVGFSVERYFALVDEGVLDEDDRVELLEGVVVSMSPANPRHAAALALADDALRAAVRGGAAIRVQMPLVLGQRSVPEPDIAVVPGRTRDYERTHPTSAFLVVEVADSTLKQDRITKTAIYAAAGIPEYWIVNLRDDRVEVYRVPDHLRARYAEATSAGAGEHLTPVALADVRIAVTDLLPGR